MKIGLKNWFVKIGSSVGVVLGFLGSVFVWFGGISIRILKVFVVTLKLAQFRLFPIVWKTSSYMYQGVKVPATAGFRWLFFIFDFRKH